MKRFVGYIADKIVKSMPRTKKVSPDIKSVPRTKLSVKESLKKGTELSSKIIQKIGARI